MRKLFMLAAITLVVAACTNTPQEPTPQIDADKVAAQLSRKPFFERNPESSAPTTVVNSEKYRLEFTGWGNEDKSFTLSFPDATTYRRVIMQYTMGSEGAGPGEYDNTVIIYVRNKADNEWYELARLFTPFGGMFDSEWEKKFYLDVTEYASMLQGDTEFKFFYGGFDATEERAHAFTLSFYGYEGEAQEVIGVQNIYDSSLNPNTGYRSWAYGIEGHSIESEERLGIRELDIPKGTREVLLRVAITGHGHDMGSFPEREGYSVINAAEFDDNYYYLTIDGTRQAEYGHIFYSNANNYMQMGTYNYDRANWAPGNPANVHYWTLKRAATEAQKMTLDMNLEKFISSFDAPNTEGAANYIISVYAFYLR